MKKTFTCILSLVATLLTLAQAPYIAWNVTNNNPNILNSLESASGITVAADGGFVFTGEVNQNPPNYNQLINVKTDFRGNILWEKKFGFLYRELAGKIRTTSDGGYINVGSVEQEGSGCHTRPTGSSLNYYDMWVYKSNSAGDPMWNFCFGSTEFEYGNDIRQLPTGGYIAVGRSNAATGDLTSNAGSYDLWAIKLSATGAKLWSKSFGTAASETGNALIITSDGKCVIAGGTGTDGYAIKIDTATGALIWQRTFTGNATEVLNGVAEDAAGNLIFTGTTNSVSGVVTGNTGGNDVWVLKTDALGNVTWSKTFGSTVADMGNAIVANANGSVVINGSTSGTDGNVTRNYGGNDQWVLQVSAAGTLDWQKNMGSTASEGGADIAKTSGGGYVTVATTNQLYSSFDINCPKGYLWAAQLGGTEQTLPAGPILWLKADAGLTTTGNLVNTWADQSGFNYNAAAVTGLAKPQLITSALNGKPVVRFTGTEGLATTSAATFGCRNRLDVFVVVKKQASATEQTIMDTYSQTPTGARSGMVLKSNIKSTSCANCTNDNGFAAGMQINNVNSYNATSTGYNTECYTIIEGKFDGSLNADEAQLFINNSRINRDLGTENGNTSGLFEARPVSVGFTTLTTGTKANFFVGDIAEIIMYPTILDATSQQTAYDYLNKKYFGGSGQPFTDVVNATTASTSFTNDGAWKHPVNSSAAGKAMVSVQDKCNELLTVGSTVFINATPVYTATTGERFLRRHYTIQATGSRRVRLYFTQQEFADYAAAVPGVNSIKDLSVVKYNGPTEDGIYNIADATQLVNITTVDTGSLYGNKYLEFDVNGFSEFWIKAANEPLPLNLLSFAASICNKNICLSWSTANEENTQNFQLQKATDGTNFSTIEIVNAIGQGNNAYSAKDKAIDNNAVYYRLKMMDKDGTFSYSKIVKINNSNSIPFTILPNPAHDVISIKNAGTITAIAIIDAMGKTVKTLLPNASNNYNISSLSTGVYFIKVVTINGTTVQRLIKN